MPRLRPGHRDRARRQALSEPRLIGPYTSEGLRLRIPASEEGAAWRRGARYDNAAGQWRVPAGQEVAVHLFQRWIAPGSAIVDYGPTVAGRVVAMPYDCYRCPAASRPIVGVLVPGGLSLDPEGLVPFDDVAELLATTFDDAALRRFAIGPLRWRRSRAVPDGYVANGCGGCSTIFGSWHLSEELIEYRAGGHRLERMAVDLQVELPVAVLEYLRGN